MRFGIPPGLVALALVMSTGWAAAAETPSLELCAELVRNRPDDLRSYRCYWVLARSGEWDEAVRALEALLAVHPGHPAVLLNLGAIEADRGSERAESLFREAAAGFAAEDVKAGEVYALLGLERLLRRLDRATEAAEELARATRLAQASGDPFLQARTWTAGASSAIARQEYGRVLRLLQSAEEVAFPDGPVDLRSHVLSLTGYAYWALNLPERALEAYERQANLLEEYDWRYDEVSARYNVALLSSRLVRTQAASIHMHIRNLERLVDLAEEVGNRTIQAKACLMLGGWKEDPEARVEQMSRALEIFESIGDRAGAREARRQLAYVLWVCCPSRHEEARALIDEAIEEASSSGQPAELARGWIGKASMLQLSAPRNEWIPAYGQAIDAVERIRDLQPDGTVGARLFTRWAFPYYRFSGKLLEELDTTPDPEGDLDLAFRTIERMRSRVLLDELDGAGVPPPVDPAHPDVKRREEVLGAIAEVQKRLSDPSLEPDRRRAALAELERLEIREMTLRAEVARAHESFAELRSPGLPGLAEIQAHLEPDQAILAFQLADREADREADIPPGGSWLVRITRDESRAFALPDRKLLEEQVTVFLGLCRRRDGSERDAAAWLFDDLLAEALEASTRPLSRLVIVPDGALHRLPFAALRPAPGSDPLGVVYDIGQAPSVTTWLRRVRGPDTDRDPEVQPAVLAFADPDIEATAGDAERRAADPWLEGVRLGALPHARSEARTMVRALGGESLLLTGPDASERFLKQADLDRFAIVHFAAHALVDPERPERSAVVLAPGGENEDGFLQIREIVDLDLRGKVIVLSACRSASGTVLKGEGLLGLGRAFFRAGARAVVGNLWPMRDDEAEAFVRRLSRRLVAGDTLAGSIAAVRRRRMEAGAPADAWAGVVVLGDGDFRPVPDGRVRSRRGAVWTLGAIGAALVLAAWVLAYRRHRR